MDCGDYEPRPIDTSSVKLPHELDEKIEELARNNHEVWARERRQGGWKYGPQRDDAKQEHPGLVPYEELSESEKDVDRQTVKQTLKAVVALGCKIRIAEPETASPSGKASSGDDMEAWPALPPGFEEPKKALLKLYRHADRLAESSLLEHKWTVRVSAFCGTLAVTAAILELASPGKNLSQVVPEFVLALFALAAVLFGLRVALAPKWLLERHRAERCRFAKYRVLLRLAGTGDDHDAVGHCLEDFKVLVREIEALDEDDLEQFMQEDPIPEDPPSVHNSHKVHHNLEELADHYVKQRLRAQAKYFFTQSRKKSAVDARIRMVSPLLFFVSIFCALSHFTYAALDQICWVREHWDLCLDSKAWLYLAALLPVAGGGFRLLRSAFEYSRNTARYRAKYRALEQLIATLEAAQNHAVEPHEVIRSIWKGELVLEQEHREWLRLMKEAEWFG
jgi:RyR domain-containing protein